jgi:hypothetical protein
MQFVVVVSSILKFDRALGSPVLITQVAAGAALGVAAEGAFLIVVIIANIMPLFGLEPLDMARDVAALNLRRGWGSCSGLACSGHH